MLFKDLWILFLIPVLWVLGFLVARKEKNAVLVFSSLASFADIKRSWKALFLKYIFILRLLILSLFLIALSAPYSALEQTEIVSDGIDIILAVDASGSMAAEDFKINGKRMNRLAIVKDVVSDFISNRSGDRIGVVVFAGLAYTVSPLTTDYEWLVENFERVELGVIQEEGTAIGSAVASSLNRLQDSEAKSKIIVLLTDGVQNVGKIEPLAAADAAAALDVKIYTIGAGSKGPVPYPASFMGRTVYQNVEIDIDEDTLKKMADKTGGQYFRATDTESLKQVYKTIDELEKVEIKQSGYKEIKQLYHYFLLGALFLLCCDLILRNTLLMRIP